MLAGFLQKEFFEPAGISTEVDFSDDSKVTQLRMAFRISGIRLQTVLDKIFQSLAAQPARATAA
jgi:hypothetical protein